MLAYWFRDSLYYHHGENMTASRQMWGWRSWEFCILIQGKQKTGFQTARGRVSTHIPTVTHLLQQGYTYTNKAIPPNSATPWVKHIQTATMPQTTFFPSKWEKAWSFKDVTDKMIKQKINLHGIASMPRSPHLGWGHCFSLCASLKFLTHA